MEQSVVNGVTQHLRLQMVFESTQAHTLFFFHLEKDSNTKGGFGWCARLTLYDEGDC